MIENQTATGDPPDRNPARAAAAEFLAELQASKEALDAAFHFDERDNVKPAYDRLMRIADAYAGLPAQLRRASASAEVTAADGATAAAIDGILAVLREMSGGAARYHALSATLARSHNAARLACQCAA